MNRELQRTRALAKANRTYAERAKVKKKINAGKLSVIDALTLPCMQSAKIETLLKAQKAWGDTKSYDFLSHLSWKYQVMIGPNRRVRDLSKLQRETLRKALEQ